MTRDSGLGRGMRSKERVVPYRDFFEFVTPLCWYLMALAFALFP